MQARIARSNRLRPFLIVCAAVMAAAGLVLALV